MDLSRTNLKGLDLVNFLAYTMGDTKNHSQYRSLILDELEKQNVELENFDDEELRKFSLQILYRALSKIS
jgi:hypothetical protein